MKNPHKSPSFGIATDIFTFLLAFTIFVHRYQKVAESVPKAGQAVRALVLSMPIEKEKTYALQLESEESAHYLVYFAKDERVQQIKIGDRVVFVPKYVDATAPHLQKDSAHRVYKNFLFYSGTSATCYVPKRNWTVVASDSAFHLSSFFRSVQQMMHENYQRAGLTGDAGAIIEAMTIGHRTALKQEQRQRFANAGISHILALSGFHLNTFLVVLNLFFFLLPISERTRRIASLFTLLPIIWIFTAIAGSPPSLIRAATMASIFQFVFVFRREYYLLNTLCLTAFLMLFWNPMQLMNVGFQLSFASMLGIAVVITPLLKDMEVKEWYKKTLKNVALRLLRLLLSIVVVSVVCTIATLPLVAYYFGQIPLLSLLSNVFATVLFYGIMCFSVLFWLFSFWSGAQSFIASILIFLGKGMESLTSFISSIPHSTISFHPNLFEVVLLYMGIVSLYVTIKKRTAQPLIVLLVSIILFSISRIVQMLQVLI